MWKQFLLVGFDKNNYINRLLLKKTPFILTRDVLLKKI